MVADGKRFHAWAPDNVVVKLPTNAEGLQATRELAKDGIQVNMTLCFSANQALLAAHAGVAFISPFVGRLDDIGHDGMQVVRDIVEIYEIHNFKTEVIAASIRHPLHCIEAARAGAHIATIPYKMLEQMLKHPLTDIGIDKFMADWKESGASRIYDKLCRGTACRARGLPTCHETTAETSSTFPDNNRYLTFLWSHDG